MEGEFFAFDATCIECAEAKGYFEVAGAVGEDATCIECAEAKSNAAMVMKPGAPDATCIECAEAKKRRV